VAQTARREDNGTMHEQREHLLEELRKAEQALTLLKELEPHLTQSKGTELEGHVRALQQLAQSLPEGHIVRLVIESALEPSNVGTVSRARSALEGEISTLQGALRYGAT
jgi:uncharacterized protein (UPF0216 family)